MSSYELTLNPIRPTRNLVNGRFLKGHVPHNKGKGWAETISKQGQENAKKGWENLIKYRPKTRADTSERCSIPVIAVLDNGRIKYFSSMAMAATYCDGCHNNIARCCKLNSIGVTPRRGKPNTDHKYKGVRFYYESDTELWMSKRKDI